MPFYLLSLAEGPGVVIDKPILLFGRHADCDVVLNSKKISRRHCCLAEVADHLLIRDLGSTNGVLVNGARVTASRLAAGDELVIGNYQFRVVSGPARGG